MKIVEGLNKVPLRNCSSKTILEVSLAIRLPIPEAAFGVDFFILLSPNLKKDFIYVGIDPYVHNKVADPATLKKGLISMYETVPKAE